MAGIEDWFLTGVQRGNPASTLAAWCAGNRVEPLVHGATYFDRFVAEVEALRRGDYQSSPTGCGDPDELKRQLMDMAGPNAKILIDSFEGRELPPKALIKSIRITRARSTGESAAAE